jgi:erythrin-vacuolar iron transport family protein
MINFAELTEQQLLALAISLEEQDARIYDEFYDGLKETYPDTAHMFRAMADEETGHRHRLLDIYQKKFGERLPLIRAQDVKGFIQRKPVWMSRPLGLDKVREMSELMEAEAKRFYIRATRQATDASVRQLLGDLAAEERRHEANAEALEEQYVSADVNKKEHIAERKLFLLQVVQPGLAGLMDGSVSTLAPLFAAAFATHSTWETFLVGLAASIGAGISMGFAEGLSDNGSLTGRGSPWLRGAASGVMTALGGLGHTMPFLIPEFHTAMVVAIGVVLVELAAISWIRNRFMDTPFLSAAFQVVIGGLLVFATGIIIGSS